MNYESNQSGLVRVSPDIMPLGMSIVREDATIPDAAQVGMVEGVSDVTRILTVGAVLAVTYMLIPRKITRRFERKMRKVL